MRYSKKNIHLNDDDAGKAIAAGGFGCVFRPPIRCNDIGANAKLNSKPYITKLMIKKYANEEIKEVERILPMIKKLPNSAQRHFLLDDIFKCKNTDSLSHEDLNGFDRKCSNLARKGLNSRNINKNLNVVGSINIPDGGKSLNDFFKLSDFKIINKKTNKLLGNVTYSIIDLIKNAVIPMNKVGLYHLDLKSDNILVGNYDDTKLNFKPELKIIDWGLAHIYSKSKNNYSDFRRVIQFNLPIGMSLLYVKDYINRLINLKFPSTIDDIPPMYIKYIASEIFDKIIKNRLDAHVPYLSDTIRHLNNFYKPLRKVDYISDSCFQDSLTYDFFILQFTEIIYEFTEKKGNKFVFNVEKYIKEVLLNNVDIYGVLMSYIEFISIAINKNAKSPELLKCLNIIYKYCFSPEYSIKPYNTNELIKELQELAQLCGVINEPKYENDIQTISSKKIIKSKKKKLILKSKQTIKSLSPILLSSKKTSSNKRKSSKKSIALSPSRKRCPRGYKRVGKTLRCIKK